MHRRCDFYHPVLGLPSAICPPPYLFPRDCCHLGRLNPADAATGLNASMPISLIRRQPSHRRHFVPTNACFTPAKAVGILVAVLVATSRPCLTNLDNRLTAVLLELALALALAPERPKKGIERFVVTQWAHPPHIIADRAGTPRTEHLVSAAAHGLLCKAYLLRLGDQCSRRTGRV